MQERFHCVACRLEGRARLCEIVGIRVEVVSAQAGERNAGGAVAPEGGEGHGAPAAAPPANGLAQVGPVALLRVEPVALVSERLLCCAAVPLVPRGTPELEQRQADTGC